MSVAISTLKCSLPLRNPTKRFMCYYLSMKTLLETAPPLPLLGPPEIYRVAPPSVEEKQGFPATNNPTKMEETKSITPTDPFMNLMVSQYNNNYYPYVGYGVPPRPFMGLTENASPTYLSSGNPCLDFFFHVVPGTPPEQVKRYLELAWEKDPLTSLKLVMNLRGILGTGKGDREGFYAAALWLHENHPKTLAYNTLAICKFGYFKDTLEILYRLLEGADVREKEKEEMRELKEKYTEKWFLRRGRRPAGKSVTQGKKGLEKYNSDESYRFLHNVVSYVFAEALKEDVENLNSGKHWEISMAAKWCPTLRSSFDRTTLLCESIARRMFPRDLPAYEGLEESHYAYRVRNRLRKEVLVPLRKALCLAEVYMTANQWDEIKYNRVPSIAMKNYQGVFLRHDEERFMGYLEKVKKGEKKIAAGALLPHEIIESVRTGDVTEVAELQWKRVIEDLLKIGKLNNCMAICDVSGSMSGTPLQVSVALGLLISELSEEPWKGKLITFSLNPVLHLIKGESLLEKASFVERMDMNMNTDFQRVFDKILQVAKAGNLSEDQMIKRLFVFSDMEFDEASLNPWETDYEAICRKFRENGYTSVPEIVFWNLRNSMSTPVPSNQKGVALVSGFSKNLVKLFMEKGGILSPEDTMMQAISGEEYEQLVVVD